MKQTRASENSHLKSICKPQNHKTQKPRREGGQLKIIDNHF